MRHLFVMDPLDRINVRGDSTYVTMRECADRGHQTWYCTPDRLYADRGRCFAVATRVRAKAEAPYFELSGTEELDLGAVDLVWMRKDPPYDMAYVFSTFLLDLVPASTLVVNSPGGLRLFQEKMWAQRFPEFHPRTLVSNDVERLRTFVLNEPGRVVLKPWNGNGGRGVLVTQKGDRNLRSMIEILTVEGREHALAQPYLDRVDEGDKRILLFGGVPVGAMLRVPDKADFRGNMHVGATVQACDLSARDQAICDALGPHLQREGLLFVGIDVIDGWLTEINVTSPTGIQEMNRLYGQKLEATLVDTALAALANHRSAA